MSVLQRTAALVAATVLLAVAASAPPTRAGTADGSLSAPHAPASVARALAVVAARVSPTVVRLHVERYAPTRQTVRTMQRFRNQRQRREEQHDEVEGLRRQTDWPMVFRYESRPRGPVTGVMVESGGLVLTSRFNVEGPLRAVHVELADGRIFPGEVLGWESDLDVAAVRVQAPAGTEFTAIPVRPRKEPAVGTFVVVVGASWGRVPYTAAAGMVSALERRGGHAIQLAANLNYGNTGGAVIDLEGRLVGIASHVRPFGRRRLNSGAGFATVGRAGLNSGVGFATAAHRLHEALPRLTRGERVPYSAPPFIGIRTREDARGKRLFIALVVPGSGADEGGVKVGDLLVAIAGNPVEEEGDVRLALHRLRVGQVVSVVVNRGGVTRRLAVRLGGLD